MLFCYFERRKKRITGFYLLLFFLFYSTLYGVGNITFLSCFLNIPIAINAAIPAHKGTSGKSDLLIN
jgi:hypothetical protein